MTSPRQAVPGQFYQGEDEELAYNVNVGNWTAAPTGACTIVKLDGADATSSVTSNTTSISGCIVTTPCLVNLVDGNSYRVEVKVRDDTDQIWEAFFFVTGEE